LLAHNISFGQESKGGEVSLSLDEALQRARSENYEIKLSEADYRSAKADFRQTNALLLPSVQIEHTATATNDPLASFGYKLQQEIVQQSDFNPALLNDPENIENFNTAITLEQPLVNIDGWYGRKAARNRVDALKYKSERTRQYIDLAVHQAYFGLQLADAQKLFLDQVVKSVEKNHQLISNYYKQGLIKKDDLLEMEVRLLEARAKQKNAFAFRQKANNGLSYLLGYEYGTTIVNTDTLTPVIGAIGKENSLSVDRADVKAYQKGVEAYENLLKSAQSGYLPRLNAFGMYNLNDDKLLGTEAESWMVGAKLSVNLFDGYRTTGKVQKAKAEFQKKSLELDSYMQLQQRELEQAQLQLQVAASNLESTDKARTSAAEAYRIRHNRFREGLVKTTDLINAETAWSNKNLEYLNALYQCRVAHEKLNFLLADK
jgi:outer membrane protein TolC